MRTIGFVSLVALAGCHAAATQPPATVLDDSAWIAPEAISINVQSGSKPHVVREAALTGAMHPNHHETFRGQSPQDHVH